MKSVIIDANNHVAYSEDLMKMGVICDTCKKIIAIYYMSEYEHHKTIQGVGEYIVKCKECCAK